MRTARALQRADSQGVVGIRPLVTAAVLIWLIAVFIAQNAPPEYLQVAAAAAVIFLPATFALVGLRPLSIALLSDAPVVERLVFALFFVMAFIGGLVSIDPTTSLSFLFLTTATMLAISRAWIASPEGVRRAVTSYALVGAPLIWVASTIFATAAPEQMDSRLAGFRNPNAVGLIAYGVAILGLAAPRRVFKILAFGAGVATVIATQSRSSLLGIFVASAVFGWNEWSRRGLGIRYLAVWGFVLLGIVAAVYAPELTQRVDDLLALDDPYRGLNSGYTGRDKLWAYAIDLFLDNPMFGVGFRLHEKYFLAGEMDYFVAGSAHNGYLATLAELGITGSLPLFAWLALRIRRLARVAKDDSAFARVAFPLICGYAVIAIFERYLINLGNPTSIAVLFMICVPNLAMLRDRSSQGAQ